MMKQVAGARCIRCGREVEATPTITACDCGGVFDIVYCYETVKKGLNRAALEGCSDRSMWRYRAALPVGEGTRLPPLRAGGSPLYDAPRLAGELGLGRLWLKDDGVNPTASLKDRASAMAIAKAREAGARVVACASTGNAASSLAGAAAAAGMESVIFLPARAPRGKVAQLMMFGARVVSVQGDYGDAFRLSAAAIDRWGWYNRNAAINPYLSEGKKTVAFEIAEQLGWRVPDFVAVSVGDGCTIAGVWKGFCDLLAVGLIDRLPRLLSVQAAGCCPIHRAVSEGAPWRPMAEETMADSIAVGTPRNAEKALAALAASDGITVSVTDEEIFDAMRMLGRGGGVFAEPAGAAGTAGLKKAALAGRLPPNATVVSIVTGNGLKDTAAAMTAAGEPMPCPPDLDALTARFAEAGVAWR